MEWSGVEWSGQRFLANRYRLVIKSWTLRQRGGGHRSKFHPRSLFLPSERVPSHRRGIESISSPSLLFGQAFALRESVYRSSRRRLLGWNGGVKGFREREEKHDFERESLERTIHRVFLSERRNLIVRVYERERERDPLGNLNFTQGVG